MTQKDRKRYIFGRYFLRYRGLKNASSQTENPLISFLLPTAASWKGVYNDIFSSLMKKLFLQYVVSFFIFKLRQCRQIQVMNKIRKD